MKATKKGMPGLKRKKGTGEIVYQGESHDAKQVRLQRRRTDYKNFRENESSISQNWRQQKKEVTIDGVCQMKL